MSDSMNDVSEEKMTDVPEEKLSDVPEKGMKVVSEEMNFASEEMTDFSDIDYNYTPYKDPKSTAEDNKSSGWILLLVAFLGFSFVILSMTGVIPVKFANNYLVCGVMFAVLSLFLVMGIISMLNAKKYENKAKGEKSLKDSLIEWSSLNLTKDKVDSEIEGAGGLSEEDLYFERTHILTDKLNHQFVNLDPLFLENLIDENLYDSIFNNDKN